MNRKRSRIEQLKTLWVLSAVLIVVGFCVFLYSGNSVTAQEPYRAIVNQTKDEVLTDGWSEALLTYYTGQASLNQGDKISIVTLSAENLTVKVIDSYRIFSSDSVVSLTRKCAKRNLRSDSTKFELLSN